MRCGDVPDATSATDPGRAPASGAGRRPGRGPDRRSGRCPEPLRRRPVAEDQLADRAARDAGRRSSRSSAVAVEHPAADRDRRRPDRRGGWRPTPGREPRGDEDRAVGLVDEADRHGAGTARSARRGGPKPGVAPVADEVVVDGSRRAVGPGSTRPAGGRQSAGAPPAGLVSGPAARTCPRSRPTARRPSRRACMSRMRPRRRAPPSTGAARRRGSREPSVTWAGPSRIRSSDPTVPTLIRVPRGSVGDGAAMPQFMPRPGRLLGAGQRRAEHQDVRAGGDRLGQLAAAAHPAVGDDRDVAAGLARGRRRGRRRRR